MSRVLTLENVTLSFGGVRALDHVSLSVDTGDILGVIGPNGAGKTSLFDVITGHVEPSEGSVRLGGRDATSWSVHRRALDGVSRGFQDAGLFGSLTVREVLSISCARTADRPGLFGSLLRLPRAQRIEAVVSDRVDELVETYGLADYANKFVVELSTGTRRVIELAALSAQRPALLLLDEPSSGIAQREVEALGHLIARIHASLGCALVIIEHDIPMVASAADELVAMHQGAIIVRARPDDVLHHPLVIESYLGTDERVVARSDASR